MVFELQADFALVVFFCKSRAQGLPRGAGAGTGARGYKLLGCIPCFFLLQWHFFSTSYGRGQLFVVFKLAYLYLLVRGWPLLLS